MKIPSGPDVDIINRSHQAYREAGVEIAGDKAFGASRFLEGKNCPGDQNFSAWGSEIRSEPGTIASPSHKRAVMCVFVTLIFFICVLYLSSLLGGSLPS